MTPTLDPARLAECAMTDEELRDAARAIAWHVNPIGDADTDAIVALARRYAESQRTAALALAGKWRERGGNQSYEVASAFRACADELAALFPEVTRG
jgi:hypothetical protein